MIMGFHHVGLVTNDLDRMIEFYRELLGFEVTKRAGWEAGIEAVDVHLALRDTAAQYVFMARGSAVVEIFQFSSPLARSTDPKRANDPGYTHFCLAVRDIDDEYERLRAAGMRFNSPPYPPLEETTPGRRRVAYGYDPDGNVIELMEPFDMASEAAGA